MLSQERRIRILAEMREVLMGIRGKTEDLVTIIIPVYNVEKYLEDSVESALKQIYKNVKIILVDDGSMDKCPQICDRYGAEYTNISVIHKENGGLSSARNAGLEQVDQNTKWILFLDSDDILLPDAVIGMVQKAYDSGADIVMPDRYVQRQEETGKEKLRVHFPQEYYITDPRQFAIAVMIGKGRAWRAHALLYSYNLIKKNNVRFPKERHAGEDLFFNLKFLEKAGSIAFYPYPTLCYRKHMGSVTTTFQKDFDKVIWKMDEKAKEFCRNTGNLDAEAEKKMDALLCRNIVIYLFSIMSKKNTGMCYDEKAEYADSIIMDRRAGGVTLKKNEMPYFQDIKTRIAVRTAYFLLQKGQYGILYHLLAAFS